MAVIDGELSPRQEMLTDVVRNVVLGADRLSVEQALGPSFDTNYFKKSGRDLIYPLGPARGIFAIDLEWLLLWLGPDGRVNRFALAVD